MKNLFAIITSVLLGFSALWGAITSPNSPTKYGPPALYMNEARVSFQAASWQYPINRGWSMHGDGGTTLQNALTVSPGSALEFSNEPYWLGTRDITISIYYAEDMRIVESEEEIYGRPGPEDEGIPINFTESGNPIAPETPGCYIAYIRVKYESCIWILTGSGSYYGPIMFTVE